MGYEAQLKLRAPAYLSPRGPGCSDLETGAATQKEYEL